MSTKYFSEFNKKRDIYEKQISENNKDPSTNIPLASYKTSIENADLRLFTAGGWINSTSIENLTELDLRQFKQGHAHRLWIVNTCTCSMML